MPMRLLRITFASPATVGKAGKIQVFKASQPDTAVDTIDIAAASFSDTIAGRVFQQTRPVFIDGNDAVIYLHKKKLVPNETYFVTVDSGVFRRRCAESARGHLRVDVELFDLRAGASDRQRGRRARRGRGLLHRAGRDRRDPGGQQRRPVVDHDQERHLPRDRLHLAEEQHHAARRGSQKDHPGVRQQRHPPDEARHQVPRHGRGRKQQRARGGEPHAAQRDPAERLTSRGAAGRARRSGASSATPTSSACKIRCCSPGAST